jgi:hypothetical protein
MKIRALVVMIAFGMGCGHGPGGKIPADTMQYNVKTKGWEPLLQYKAPDIDDITGIDSDAEPAAETK